MFFEAKKASEVRLGKRIYVGNLPWSITKKKLEELFSPFGDIEDALVIANKYTGRSRGFGFVTFKTDKSADEAIQEMDRKDVEGRSLVVKEARPMEERSKKEWKKESERDDEEQEAVMEEVEEKKARDKERPRARKARKKKEE